MPKKNKKKIAELAAAVAKQCIITEPKPSTSNAPKSKGVTIFSDKVDPDLIGQWPKLRMRVPPVFLHNPVEFEQHVKKLIMRGVKFYQPHRGNNYIRVYCETFNDHKHFTKYLEKMQIPYHTYGNPSNRKMKVVIRDLPDKLDVNDIKEELKSHDIPVIRTHKMKTGKGSKSDTMLVLAVVPYNEEGINILKLVQLLGYQVELQPPRDKAKQCYRCQKWGHAQRYCHGRVTCVKCAGDHLTKKCDKRPTETPTCANCKEAHTASYRKCIFTRRSMDYTMMQDIQLVIPCYKPKILVTEKNYEKLYRNVDYSQRIGKPVKPSKSE